MRKTDTKGWVRPDDATERSRSGQVGGQATRKQEAACREHLSLSQGQTRLREEAVSYFSFRTPCSQGSSFFNTAHMNPLRVFYDADSDSGALRWDLGFPFLANFWMILMLLVQGSCVMQQSLRPTQKEAKQVTRKLAGVGSRGPGGSIAPSRGSPRIYCVSAEKAHSDGGCLLYNLNCPPKRYCQNPNPYQLRMWLYLEIGSLPRLSSSNEVIWMRSNPIWLVSW